MTRLMAGSIALITSFVAGIAILGESLFVEDNPDKADFCHVLAGSQARLHYAFDLYHRGLCSKLIFIGTHAGKGRSRYAEQRQKQALDNGVPADDVLLDKTRVFSTFAEIERLANLIHDLAPKDKPTVMVISDPHHMRRSRMVVRWLVGNQANTRMRPLPFERSRFERAWWTDLWSIEVVIQEGIKMVYYQIRYPLSSTCLNPWIAALEKING